MGFAHTEVPSRGLGLRLCVRDRAEMFGVAYTRIAYTCSAPCRPSSKRWLLHIGKQVDTNGGRSFHAFHV